MPIIVGIKFKTTPKTYYFDPNSIEFSVGDGVIVETERGQEYAHVTIANREVDQESIVGDLKKVLRKATEEDNKRRKENEEKNKIAATTCAQKAEKHNVPMHVVNAEYTFDRSKVTIYFTAENRVDFRELVKDLASVLKTRIELRQIYERDDVQLKGSMAQCGRECCCMALSYSRDKATVKMAKIQGIALNPTKTNGVCGKLMCCLRYENQYYEDVNKVMPRVGSFVDTVEGKGRVMRTDLLRRQFSVLITKEDESQEMLMISLDDYLSKGEVITKETEVEKEEE